MTDVSKEYHWQIDAFLDYGEILWVRTPDFLSECRRLRGSVVEGERRKGRAVYAIV